MSYRDLRNFTEMMRAIGYKRLISMESFKNPNFNLMADILRWFVLSFDPEAQIPQMENETCGERIQFINFVSTFMLTTANIKVNPKKLYESNGRSVKELSKIASILYEAQKLQKSASAGDGEIISGNDDEEGNDGGKIKIDGGGDESEETNVYAILSQLANRKEELHDARKLAKELSETAANLYFALANEVDLHGKRIEAINSDYDIHRVDGILDEMINETKREVLETMEKVEQTTSDELKLESKFEAKVLEMERCLRRFESLRKVRPVYQEELNDLEEEMKDLHTEYLEKHRNMGFLEEILERYGRHEKEIKELSLRLVAKRKQRLSEVVASNSKSSLSSVKADDKDSNKAEESQPISIADHLPILPYRADLAPKTRKKRGHYFGLPNRNYARSHLLAGLLPDGEDEEDDDDDDEDDDEDGDDNTDEEERLMMMMMMKNLRDAGVGVMCEDESAELRDRKFCDNFRTTRCETETRGHASGHDSGIYREGIEGKHRKAHPLDYELCHDERRAGRRSHWMGSNLRSDSQTAGLEGLQDYFDDEEDDDNF